MKDSYDRHFRTLQATCALYMERHHEWPAWAAVEPTILQDLAFVLATEGVTKLAGLIQLRTTQQRGISVGGAAVVHQNELRPVENVPDVQWLVFAEQRYKVALKDYPLDALVDVCALYCERHGEWPTSANLPPATAQQLAYVLAPDRFQRLGDRLELEVVEGQGITVRGAATVRQGELEQQHADIETRMRAHHWLNVWDSASGR